MTLETVPNSRRIRRYQNLVGAAFFALHPFGGWSGENAAVDSLGYLGGPGLGSFSLPSRSPSSNLGINGHQSCCSAPRSLRYVARFPAVPPSMLSFLPTRASQLPGAAVTSFKVIHHDLLPSPLTWLCRWFPCHGAARRKLT